MAQPVSGSGIYQFSQALGSGTAAFQNIVGNNYQVRSNGSLTAQNVSFGNGVTAEINYHHGSGQNRSGHVLEATFSTQVAGSRIPETWKVKIEFGVK